MPELVQGRRATPPFRGFGQLWRKRYRAWFLSPRDAADVVRDWQRHLSDTWPPGQDLHSPRVGMRPGSTAVAHLHLSGMPLVAGLKIMESSPNSFSLSTAEGHMFAGVIRFSVEREGELRVASVEATVRASDPLFEVGLMTGGHKREDAFWRQTLRRTARRYGIFQRMTQEYSLIDPRRRWRAAGNLRNNSAVLTPLRAAFHSLKRDGHG